MARQQRIAKSIVRSILSGDEEKTRSLLSRFIAALLNFFAFFQFDLVRFKSEIFQNLRKKWAVKEDEYEESFRGKDVLSAKGDMGFSGSTFFTTENGAYLVKSVPRSFEHTFFRDDLLEPYASHMLDQTKSLLIRITDFLASSQVCIGGLIGTAPTHHIVMENILIGKNEAWETFDLKPTSYFFPERDIAGGALTSDDTKDRLADKFEDKICLTQSEADDFLGQLERDTRLLEECNAVDYSLFLVRIPISPEDPFTDEAQEDAVQETADQAPFVPPQPPSWRTGVKSADGKYVFRAAVLDFFWAKHKVHAKFMTFLIKTWNLVGRQGPMSITTTSYEYRERFLKMCREIVEVQIQ